MVKTVNNWFSKVYDKRGQDYLISYYSFLSSCLFRVPNVFHPFHVVQPSFLPIAVSFVLTANLFNYMIIVHYPDFYCAPPRLLYFLILFSLIHVWILSVNEEERQGCHTTYVQKGFRIGIALFILSEVMLFVSFFAAFFYFSLNPASYTGAEWPLVGILGFDWSKIPTVNSAALISSGIVITLAHMLARYWDAHCLVGFWQAVMTAAFPETDSQEKSFGSVYKNLIDNNNTIERWVAKPDLYVLDTILRGIVFVLCQYIEYVYATFTISDGSYGSVFFMTTGLHGLHVIVGLTCLLYCFLSRIVTSYRGVLYWTHSVGFDGSIWYWHFVDVVWLFLFLVVYVWFGK